MDQNKKMAGRVSLAISMLNIFTRVAGSGAAATVVVCLTISSAMGAIRLSALLEIHGVKIHITHTLTCVVFVVVIMAGTSLFTVILAPHVFCHNNLFAFGTKKTIPVFAMAGKKPDETGLRLAGTVSAQAKAHEMPQNAPLASTKSVNLF